MRTNVYDIILQQRRTPEEMELLNLKIRAWKSTKEPCHIKHVTWAHCNPLQRPCSIQTREINARLASNVQQTKQSKGILSADKKNKNILPLCAQPVLYRMQSFRHPFKRRWSQ
jgi:hypothetical protein